MKIKKELSRKKKTVNSVSRLKLRSKLSDLTPEEVTSRFNAHLGHVVKEYLSIEQPPVKINKWYTVKDRLPPYTDDYILCKYASNAKIYALQMSSVATQHILMDQTYYQRKSNIVSWMLFEQR